MPNDGEVTFGLDENQDDNPTAQLAAGATEVLTPAPTQDPEESERASRVSETRDSEKRVASWKPPQLLDAPTPEMGYHHRWIRYEVNGTVDHKNLAARFREGYEPVPQDAYPDFECTVLDGTHGKHAGTFTTGGLILCRIPVEIVKQREAYFNARSDDADRAVDNDLLKANDPRMPFDNSQRHSQVTFGGGRQ